MKKTGFTLVEILIVVIILGILAAIVIPQFTEASNDARKSALVSDLQTCRSQLELFKVQHLDTYPGCFGANFSAANFLTQLATKTNSDCTAVGNLGPYLMKFPSNPFMNDDATVREVTLDANGDAPIAGTEGWWFDPAVGKFGANHIDFRDY